MSVISSAGIARATALMVLALWFAVPVGAQTLQQQVEALQDATAPTVSNVPLFSGRLLTEFYAERGYRNAWDGAQARAMLELARQSRADGFDPEDFHAAAIERLLTTGQLEAAAGEQRAAADILLSDALARYVHHFRFGKYNPRHINRDQVFVGKADAEALKADMKRVLAAPDLTAELAALLPHPSFYENLKLGYQRYLEIADRGGWKDIPGGALLRVGTKDSRVPLIRERLAVTDGYRAASGSDPNVYDSDLAEAVKGFQQRSGLAPDGVVGPSSLRALNHSLADRLQTIRANLERMRWLYNELPDDYLFVDVTAFRLHLIRDNKEVWNTRVVVGTPDSQTPMFRDDMEHVVFNPTWTMPVSIQKTMRGVGSRYQVVDRRTGRRVSGADISNYQRYRIVQAPGPRNALGRVKFMFPNGHAIYLHDTPSRQLFSRSVRAYSHGCIRVQEPLTLARYVLNKPSWDHSAINRVVGRGQTRYVFLDDHLPVLLYYLTAVADEQGRVGFRRDIYHRDKPLFAVLDKPADGDRIAFQETEPDPEAAKAIEGAPAQMAGDELPGHSNKTKGIDDALSEEDIAESAVEAVWTDGRVTAAPEVTGAAEAATPIEASMSPAGQNDQLAPRIQPRPASEPIEHNRAAHEAPAVQPARPWPRGASADLGLDATERFSRPKRTRVPALPELNLALPAAAVDAANQDGARISDSVALPTRPAGLHMPVPRSPQPALPADWGLSPPEG